MNVFGRKQQTADDWFDESPGGLDDTSWDAPEREFFDDLGPNPTDGKLRASGDDLFGDGPRADAHHDNALLFGDDPIFLDGEGDGETESDLVFTDVDEQDAPGPRRWRPAMLREQKTRALLAGAGASVLLVLTGTFGAILLTTDDRAPSEVVISGSPVTVDAGDAPTSTAPDTTFLPPLPSTAAPVPIPTGVPVSAAPPAAAPPQVSVPQSSTQAPSTAATTAATTASTTGKKAPVKTPVVKPEPVRKSPGLGTTTTTKSKTPTAPKLPAPATPSDSTTTTVNSTTTEGTVDTDGATKSTQR